MEIVKSTPLLPEFDPNDQVHSGEDAKLRILGSAERAGRPELDVVSACLDVLHQKAVEQIVIEPLTYDLRVTFAGGYCITTFVSALHMGSDRQPISGTTNGSR